MTTAERKILVTLVAAAREHITNPQKLAEIFDCLTALAELKPGETYAEKRTGETLNLFQKSKP